MNNLVKRVAVGVIGIPLFIFVIIAGKEFFLISILIISSLCIWEFLKMSENKNTFPLHYIPLIFNILNIGIFYTILNNNEKDRVLTALLTFLFLLLFFNILNLALNLWNKKENNFFNISVNTQSYNYISNFFLSLVVLREFSNFHSGMSEIGSFIRESFLSYSDWGWVVMALFISIWAGDSGAYFIGSAIGKHKLFERISPKKSWEGAIAGFVFSIFGFVLTMYLAVPQFPLELSFILGAVIGIVGTIGDLAESQLKRDTKVKDSSNLIPGHGGFLDRFDSILFSSPIVFAIVTIYFLFVKQ